MRFALMNVASTISVDLPARPDSGATFTVLNPQGGSIQSATTATIDSVNTTVSGSLSAGATSATLVSATGVVVGRRYVLGTTSGVAASEDLGGEWVTVKSKVSSTVTFARPLQRAQTAGPLFQSARISCSVPAIGVIGRNYRIEVTWASDGGTTMPTFVVPFDVVRYQPVSMLREDDLADLDPVIGKRLPQLLWWPAMRDRAWDMILARVAQKVAPGAIVGSIDLTTPHLYLCRYLLAEVAGEPWAEYAKKMSERFNEELQASLGATAVDDDQDGSIEPQEGWRRTVVLQRGG